MIKSDYWFKIIFRSKNLREIIFPSSNSLPTFQSHRTLPQVNPRAISIVTDGGVASAKCDKIREINEIRWRCVKWCVKYNVAYQNWSEFVLCPEWNMGYRFLNGGKWLFGYFDVSTIKLSFPFVYYEFQLNQY